METFSEHMKLFQFICNIIMCLKAVILKDKKYIFSGLVSIVSGNFSEDIKISQNYLKYQHVFENRF